MKHRDDDETIVVPTRSKEGRNDSILLSMRVADDDQCIINASIGTRSVDVVGDTFFEALVALRIRLEALDLLICCMGARADVYPSPMALSMGNGRLAYRIAMGRPALSSDLVDIFGVDESCTPATVEEQRAHYERWVYAPKDNKISP